MIKLEDRPISCEKNSDKFSFMKNQYSTTILTVDLAAIRENYRILQKICGSNCKISGVVKANAYGLGIEPVAKTLAGEGCDEFFVANLDEALTLRKILPDITIFVLHGIMPGEEEAFEYNKITPVLNSIQHINLLLQRSVLIGYKLPCAIHFNTGMNRLGFDSISGKKFLLDNDIIQKLDVKYITSHLACSDEANNPMNKQQLVEFQNITKDFEGERLSFANSGAVFLGNEYHFNMARCGLALYGGNPNNSSINPMKNVVKLTSKMLQIHQIDRDGTVGYGASHKVTAGTKTATIAIGYADGYLRSLSNSGICAVDGIIVPIIGRVSMDLVILDVTNVPDSKLEVGREVELIGENIPVETVALKAGTISYEILTSLGPRYKRVYI